MRNRRQSSHLGIIAILQALLLAMPADVLAHTAGEGNAWASDPLVPILLVVSAILYVCGTRRLWRASHAGAGIGYGQAACYWTGWLTLALALLSPLDPLGESLFSAHMVQHQLMMQIAAPLLVLGRPLAVFLWAFPSAGRRRCAAAARSRPVQTVWQAATRPFAAWAFQAVALWAWHAPFLFQAALANGWIHAFEHFSFLLSALLFWWALLQGRPGSAGAGIVYLLTTAIHTGVLGVLLTFSAHVWYPIYGAGSTAWGLSPLEDQQLGGLIMWIPGGMAYLVAMLVLAARLLQAPASTSTRAH